MNATNNPVSSPKNIRLITDSYWPLVGGVEEWVHSIGANLSKKSRASIITHACGPKRNSIFLSSFFFAKGEKDLDDSGNPIITLMPSFLGRIALLPLVLWYFPLARRFCPERLFDFLFIFYRIAFSRRLHALLKNADIAHSFSTGYLGALATKVCLANSIPIIHSPPVHFNKWGDTPLMLNSYARADAIMCLSQAFKNDFIKRITLASCEIAVIPAPVKKQPAATGPGPDINHPFVLFLGRREEHKGVKMLVSAFKKVSCRAWLVFGGPGDPLASADQSIVDVGIVDELTKHRLLESCDVLCVPSRDESFGIVYAEAMMHGKPVVALDVAPVNEIVINGVTGLLVHPGSEDLLADALNTLLANPEKRKEMGSSGYKRYCDFFEEGVVMKKITDLYERVLRLSPSA
ncbi:MAG: glycosyltransferase family 4 protein [Chitinivibrionales bacterium]